MGSQQRTVDYLLDQLSQVGGVYARKMFGEYAIYCEDKVVALVCDDQLFVKKTKRGQEYLGKPLESPPYPGAKPCFLISGEQLEDSEWLSNLIKISASELPKQKPKSKTKSKPKNKTTK